MASMNAYDRQLSAAVSQLGISNPMFDFAASDPETQSRQLKTWWGRTLSEDHIHGHDPAGPISAELEILTDEWLILLSYLQRGLRGRSGDWSATAVPAPDSALEVSLTGYGYTATVVIGERGADVGHRGAVKATSVQAGDPAWVPALIFRVSYLEAPAGDLLDAVALATAFARSPFAGAASLVSRIDYNTLETPTGEIALDWREQTARPDEEASAELAAVSGLTPEMVVEALGAVLRRAVDLGHSVPAALPEPVAVAAPAGGAMDGRSILEGMGINLPADTQVIALPAGASASMSVGIGANGDLVVSDHYGSVQPAVLDPEEALMAEIAASMNIPLDVFRGIVKGGDEEDDDNS